MSELTFNLDPAVAEAADKVRALARCSPAWYNWLSATLHACGVCLCECVGWGCVCVCSMYACRYVGDVRMCVGGGRGGGCYTSPSDSHPHLSSASTYLTRANALRLRRRMN